MNISDAARHGSASVLVESYPVLGYNYRMTDVQAAVGRAQLRRLDEIVCARRTLATGYAERLELVPGVRVPVEADWARSNWQSYCVRLPKNAVQRSVMQAMLDRGVATRRGIMCAHREPAYAGFRGPHRLDHSERAQDECVILPLYPGMGDLELDQVTEALRAALR